MPVYSRADLSRTVALVVALFLTAATTNAFAREFRTADTQSENYPTARLGDENETIEQTRAGAERYFVGPLSDRAVAAMAPIYAKARRVPAAAELIERIDKVG